MKTHIKHTILYAIAIALTKGIALVMIPLVTRYVTIAEYGVLEILVSIADMGTIVLGLGLADTLFRFAGKAKGYDEQKSICACVFGLSVIITLVSIPLVQMLAPLIVDSFAIAINIVDIRLILFTLTLTSCIQIPLGWMRMQDEAWLFFKLMVGKAFLQSSLVASLLIFGEMGITAILLGGAIADILFTILLCVIQLKITGISFNLKLNRKFSAYGLPLIVVGIAGFAMGSFDRWILADYISATQLAEYGLAAKFGIITFLLIEPFNMWWFPRRFKILYNDGGVEKVAYIVNSALAMVILLAASVSIFGPVAIYILTPESYHGAMIYVPVLAAITALNAGANIVNVGVYAQKTAIIPALINITSAVVAVAGYYLFIPEYGIAGTLYVTIGAFATRFTLYYTISQRKIYIPYAIGRLIAVATIAVAGIAVILPFIANPVNYILYGALVLMLLLITVIATRLLPVREIIRGEHASQYI